MTDLLGEALAHYGTGRRWSPKLLTIVAAARNWHTLTNHDAAMIERVADALAVTRYTRPRKTMLKGIQRQLRVEARAVVDALTDTAEEENE